MNIKQIQLDENRIQDYRQGVTYTSNQTEIRIPYDAPDILLYYYTKNNTMTVGFINIIDDVDNRPHHCPTDQDCLEATTVGQTFPKNKIIPESNIDPMKYKIELYEK